MNVAVNRITGRKGGDSFEEPTRGAGGACVSNLGGGMPTNFHIIVGGAGGSGAFSGLTVYNSGGSRPVRRRREPGLLNENWRSLGNDGAELQSLAEPAKHAG